MNFNEIISIRRKELKMTQKELARKLNVSDKTISRWETNSSYPDINMIPKIANTLGITINELYEYIPKTKKKSIKRLIIYFSLVLIFLSSIVVCGIILHNNYYKWVPSIQGSNIQAFPYEEIEGSFEVHYYSNYDEFKNETIANHYFIHSVPAKQERYSKLYFKENQLLIIKFNYQADYHFYFKEVFFTGNKIEINLVGTFKNTNETMKTYYCFLETKNEIKSKEVNFKIEEIIKNESKGFFKYIDANNEPTFFEERNHVVPYLITNLNGLNFYQNLDEGLYDYDYISNSLNLLYNEEFFLEHNLYLIQVKGTVLSNYSAHINEGILYIRDYHTNHYGIPLDDIKPNDSIILIEVSKETEINSLDYARLYEYVDILYSSKYCTSNDIFITKNLVESEINTSIYRYN